MRLVKAVAVCREPIHRVLAVLVLLGAAGVFSETAVFAAQKDKVTKYVVGPIQLDRSGSIRGQLIPEGGGQVVGGVTLYLNAPPEALRRAGGEDSKAVHFQHVSSGPYVCRYHGWVDVADVPRQNAFGRLEGATEASKSNLVARLGRFHRRTKLHLADCRRWGGPPQVGKKRFDANSGVHVSPSLAFMVGLPLHPDRYWTLAAPRRNRSPGPSMLSGTHTHGLRPCCPKPEVMEAGASTVLFRRRL